MIVIKVKNDVFRRWPMWGAVKGVRSYHYVAWLRWVVMWG